MKRFYFFSMISVIFLTAVFFDCTIGVNENRKAGNNAGGTDPNVTSAARSGVVNVYDNNPACFFNFNRCIKTLPQVYTSSVPSVLQMRGSNAENCPSIVTGKYGNGVYFSGNTGCYLVADNALSINFGTGDFSIAVWIKTSKSYATIVEKRSSSTNAGYHFILYQGKLLFQLGNVSSYGNFWNSSSAAINNSLWHLVAVTVDRDNATGGRLYVDGRLIHTFNPTGFKGSTDNTAPLYIGKHRDNSWPFQGVIDELYMTHTILSQALINSMYYADYINVNFKNPKGVWFWHTNYIKGDTTEIFNFLSANNITEIYLQIDQSMPYANYASFISTAKSKGMTVQALDGDPL